MVVFVDLTIKKDNGKNRIRRGVRRCLTPSAQQLGELQGGFYESNILGPMAEENLDRVMTLAEAHNLSLMGFFIQRWLTVVLMSLTVPTLVYSFVRGTNFRKNNKEQYFHNSQRG